MLILLAVGLVGLGAAVAVWMLPVALAGKQGQPAATQRATATVLTPQPCASAGAKDVVEVHMGDNARRAQLDGCGHREGEVIDVEVPANAATSSDLVVQLAGTGSGLAGGIEQRLRAALLALSGVAGAGYALLIRRTRPTPVQ